MKTMGILSVKRIFGMTAAGFFLAAGGPALAVEISPALQAAALQAMPAENNTAIEHCGCDTKKGIEMYVQNLINDAKERGLSCRDAMHIPACITTYCSICRGHKGLVENCIQTGVEYFSRSSEFCAPENSGVAFQMPDMRFLNQFAN